MLFSATITGDVKRLAYQWCESPKEIDAEPEQATGDTVQQVVYLANSDEKYVILYNLLTLHAQDRTIIFTNMKGEARRLSERLRRDGIDCVLLSGDVPQKKRNNRLEAFRRGSVKALVATDVAGRGIHIDDIRLVVNYTLPYEPEDYVHRIGRTGRAGALGKAVSFACEEGSFYLPAIEELLEEKLECILPEEDLLKTVPKFSAKKRSDENRGQSSATPRNRKRRRRPSAGSSNESRNLKKEPKNGEKS